MNFVIIWLANAIIAALTLQFFSALSCDTLFGRIFTGKRLPDMGYELTFLMVGTPLNARFQEWRLELTGVPEY